MTHDSLSDSLLSSDGRVEVVFELENLPSSIGNLVMDAAVSALDAEHTAGPDQITVMITGDEEIQRMNRDFKGEHQVTDVLSFNEHAGESGESDYEWAFESDEDSGRLGDIAISLPQVERQAPENGKTTESELAMLTIHGVLHLLGYDHAEPKAERVMFGKTDVILAGVMNRFSQPEPSQTSLEQGQSS